MITGAFSLTRQAVQLGLLPRLEVRFTSETHQGQIYLPRVNALLLVAVIALVVLFGSSSSLASRLRHRGVRHHGGRRRCSPASSSAGAGAGAAQDRRSSWCRSSLIDLTFFSSNLLKVLDGGYVPAADRGGLSSS